MEFLNVQLIGLGGRPHPALTSVTTTRDIPKLRIHLKFLTGDYPTSYRLARDRGTNDNYCRICSSSCEDTKHILVECRATSEYREKLLPELLNTVASIDPSSKILDITTVSSQVLTQFILDCTSLNLSNSCRLSYSHPRINEVFRLSRDWCFALNNARSKFLRNL